MGHKISALTSAASRQRERVSANYDLAKGEAIELEFINSAERAGFKEMAAEYWPTETRLDHTVGDVLFREGDHSAVYRLSEGTIVFVRRGGGDVWVKVAAESSEAARKTMAAFRLRYPATQLTATDARVPITFWTYGPYGAQRRLRMIDASPWADIERNYTASVKEDLAAMMHGFEPGKDGQLILWQGEPGTGKTWALRALASEWLEWAEFHYITDPDAFFIEQPSYMIDVLLSDTYTAIDSEGERYDESNEDKWRVLILEDTGELLSQDAREKSGQGLSRLLNVVDGLIGQGLRVLCLVTTNDELGELNDAVKRPGRCAAQIEFLPMSAHEAALWLGADVDGDDVTLAELYSRSPRETPEEPLEAAEIDAQALSEASTTTREQVAAVAAAHADEMDGYGETAWNEETGTVLYVSGDWTDPDPIDADYLAIDGVNAVEHEAEGLPSGWWEAEVVYPENPPKWVMEPPDEEAELASIVELAAKPLLL